MAVQIVGLASLQEKLKALGAAVAVEKLETAARAGALLIRNEAESRAPKRTRTLGRSIHLETVEKITDRVVIAIGTDLEYAAIHEFGGTITPKKGKFLAIPLTSAARQAVEPSNYPGKLAAVIGSDGEGVLVDENDEAQYALKKHVTIPARPYLRPAFDTKRGEAVQEVGAALTELLENTIGG